MDLEIWQDAITIGVTLFDFVDKLESKRLYRFAEQLRGSGLSMSNNIAEGSGSNSKREFSNFLNIARRSTFENANVLIVMEKRKLERKRSDSFVAEVRSSMPEDYKLPENSSRLTCVCARLFVDAAPCSLLFS